MERILTLNGDIGLEIQREPNGKISAVRVFNNAPLPAIVTYENPGGKAFDQKIPAGFDETISVNIPPSQAEQMTTYATYSSKEGAI